jgi:hypothetical protein
VSNKQYVVVGILVLAVGLIAAIGFLVLPAGFYRLHPAVWDASFGCNKTFYCGQLVAVSCHPEVDGLVTYYNNTDATVVMHCGGACMMSGPAGSKGCTACPPPEWTCARPPGD